MESHRLPAHDHLDDDQLSGLAIRTLHPDLLPARLVLSADHSRVTPCENSEDGY